MRLVISTTLALATNVLPHLVGAAALANSERASGISLPPFPTIYRLVLTTELFPLSIVAWINPCIFLPHKPIEPITITWTIGSSDNHCLDQPPMGAKEMSITERGLTCKYLDIVSTAEGGNCRYRASKWGLSYNTTNPGSEKGSSMSGSAVSEWHNGPRETEITVASSSSPGTSICAEEYLCEDRRIEWKHSRHGQVWVRPPLGLLLVRLLLLDAH